MTMVERVARAMDPDYWEQVDCPLARIANPNIYEWDGVKDSLAKARAAIEAMREPTGAMLREPYYLDIGERGSPIKQEEGRGFPHA
jgi:hypothetical protein